ncbi:uncharacterized protein LOC133296820 [Gastrolobium bilobum]|uniref:uncharacterized protein LOC133296820 n=1 Tax=Gastrolobium bilobum TaxID=150636 RepID=UPI002AB2850C|nr:uncharacterized protein LOC133296820 [Gastrolobium bilobum]
MKREGRQHGMVRSYRILPSTLKPNTRFVTRFDSPPTAGLFTKVPSKPTNHSKFTAKCGTPHCTICHLNPTCKSKNKTKGNQKHKHSRVMDRPDSNFSGLSVTMTLDILSNVHIEDEVEDESGDQDDYHMDYSCTLNDGICISEMGLPLGIDHVEEEKDEDNDWCWVEPCS